MTNDLIQLGDKFYKEHPVVMLPTEEASPLVMNNIQQGLFLVGGRGVLAKYRMGDCTNQHLYFLSDEEIKAGVWVRHTNNDIGLVIELLPHNEYVMKLLSGVIVSGMRIVNARKIIATTNPDLKIPTTRQEKIVNPGVYDKSLPRPSNGFLEAYVREYNEGNKIESVLIEYNMSVECACYYTKFCHSTTLDERTHCRDGQDPKHYVKLAPDNTITCKSTNYETK